MLACISLPQTEQSWIGFNDNENNSTKFMQIIHEAIQYQQGIPRYGVSILIDMCTDYINTFHRYNILPLKIHIQF